MKRCVEIIVQFLYLVFLVRPWNHRLTISLFSTLSKRMIFNLGQAVGISGWTLYRTLVNSFNRDVENSAWLGKSCSCGLVDFRKAFDSVSHYILDLKLKRDFGITGSLLDWIKNHWEERRQFTELNNVASHQLDVTMGIPQGSVLGPTLFTLFTNDLPISVTSGVLYMYADDTTIYCIGDSVDIAIAQLNKALNELYIWCLNNRLTPHPGKSEVMMVLSRGIMMSSVAAVYTGESILKLVTQTHLLGMMVDNKLSWLPHVLEVKKSFVTKLELLKRSKFLHRAILREFYFKVILPSVKYGLVLWGSCCTSDVLKSIERLHCRAAIKRCDRIWPMVNIFLLL